MIGVYKIYQKAKPTKFKIVGTANFEAYWEENGDKTLDFTLLRECNKVELPRFTELFTEKFKSTWNEPEEKKEVETAVKKEPVMETAVKAPLTYKGKRGKKK
jgi:hypothetical protein